MVYFKCSAFFYVKVVGHTINDCCCILTIPLLVNIFVENSVHKIANTSDSAIDVWLDKIDLNNSDDLNNSAHYKGSSIKDRILISAHFSLKIVTYYISKTQITHSKHSNSKKSKTLYNIKNNMFQLNCINICNIPDFMNKSNCFNK